ncbi:hypothetical protein GVAV_002729 [Gurleya vavrai]
MIIDLYYQKHSLRRVGYDWCLEIIVYIKKDNRQRMPRKKINKYISTTLFNTDNQRSDDKEVLMRNVMKQERSFKEKERHASVKLNAKQDNCIFSRSMDGEKVRMEIFILECEEKFEDKSLKGKMMEIIKRSSEEVKNAFYKRGVANELHDSWEMFKHWIVEFCTGTSIENMNKYLNESWSNYCIRLQGVGMVRGWTEDAIIEKLRNLKLPSEMKIMIFSSGITLDKIIDSLIKMENNDQLEKCEKNEKRHTDIGRSYERVKRCFKCQKIGHLQKKIVLRMKKRKLNVINAE